jgi:hypothetical protein
MLRHPTAALLLVLSSSSCSPPPPQQAADELPGAAVTYVLPAFSGPQDYYVGRDSVTGRSAVVIREVSTHVCSRTFLGGTDGQLTDTVQVTMGNSGDSFEVLTDPTSVQCSNGLGVTYYLSYSSVPSNSGYSLYAYGGSGDDFFDCNSTWAGSVSCYGSLGDDFMLSRVAVSSVFMRAGEGDDTLVSTAWNAATRVNMDGEYGNDCLDSSAYPAATYDCGAALVGNAKRSTHVLGAHCQSVVASCP